MVHTLPDYTTKYKTSTISALADDGELAVRLGSMDIFDRRGNILWMDDFEGTYSRWQTQTAGTGAAYILDNNKSVNDSQSMKITLPIDDPNYASINRLLQAFKFKRFGFEFTFIHNDDIQYMTATVNNYDTNEMYNSQVRYKMATKTLEVSTGSAEWHTVASDLKILSNDELFHTLKIVYDVNIGEYVRLILYDLEYDISGLPIHHVVTPGYKYTKLAISYINNIATNTDVWIDRVIVTQNEP